MTTVLLGAAEPQAKSAEPQAKKSAAVPTPPRRTEIPAGAVERDPGRFFYTDKDGKKWIFVRTPFGISRTEDTGAPAPASDTAPAVKATESGDTVTFERLSAFGVTKWQKKKADLTDDEKEALRRSQKSSGKAAGDREVTTKQDR
jgi:hypothetical protein